MGLPLCETAALLMTVDIGVLATGATFREPATVDANIIVTWNFKSIETFKETQGLF